MNNITKLASTVAVAAALTFTASTVNAAPFTEDFDSIVIGTTPVTSFTSGLFTFTFEATGDGGDLADDNTFGEGGTNGIETVSGAINLATIEEISITLTAGGSFIWDSIWIDDFNGSGAATDLIGMLGAATAYTTTVPDLGVGGLPTVVATGGVEVDTVLIQSADFNFLIFDTFKGETIDPPAAVPAPGTLALFGFGLAGLGYARRCKVA
jgi:hypothetical protein